MVWSHHSLQQDREEQSGPEQSHGCPLSQVLWRMTKSQQCCVAPPHRLTTAPLPESAQLPSTGFKSTMWLLTADKSWLSERGDNLCCWRWLSIVNPDMLQSTVRGATVRLMNTADSHSKPGLRPRWTTQHVPGKVQQSEEIHKLVMQPVQYEERKRKQLHQWISVIWGTRGFLSLRRWH